MGGACLHVWMCMHLLVELKVDTGIILNCFSKFFPEARFVRQTCRHGHYWQPVGSGDPQSPPSKAGITNRTSYLYLAFMWILELWIPVFTLPWKTLTVSHLPSPLSICLIYIHRGIGFLSYLYFLCIYLFWRELSQFISKGQRTTFGHCSLLVSCGIELFTTELFNYWTIPGFELRLSGWAAGPFIGWAIIPTQTLALQSLHLFQPPIPSHKTSGVCFP